MTLINIEWTIKDYKTFVFNFVRIGHIGSLLYFYADCHGIDIDVLFLKKPILWIVEKIKNLFK